MKESPLADVREESAISTTLRRAAPLSFRRLVEAGVQGQALLQRDELDAIAGRAYRSIGQCPWDVAPSELGACFHVDVASSPTDEHNVLIFSEIGRLLLEPTVAARSWADQCRLMIELALPLPLLRALKRGRLPAPRLGLPSWFWRLGLARLPHSGMMATP